MGSQTHVQGAGSSISLLGRRTLPAFEETLAQRNADARFAVYIRSLGNGLHEVHNLCNSQPYTVGSIAAGLTFAKGQIVILGSNRGSAGEVILGVAPPNLETDGTIVNLSIATAPYKVRLAPSLGATMYTLTANTALNNFSAGLHNPTTGAYLGERAQGGDAPGPYAGGSAYGVIGCISQDSAGHCGPGSFIFARQGFGQRAYVWDIASSTLKFLPWDFSSIQSPPIYADGFLWFMRCPPTQDLAGSSEFQLWRCLTDCTGDVEVGTFVVDHFGGYTHVQLYGAYQGQAALSATGYTWTIPWVNADDSSISGKITVRMARAGGPSSGAVLDPATPASAASPVYGVPFGTAGSLLAYGGALSTLATRADSPLSSDYSVAWPTTGDFVLPSVTSASLSRGVPQVAAIYGIGGDGHGRLVAASPVAPASATVVALQDGPLGPPGWAFLSI